MRFILLAIFGLSCLAKINKKEFTGAGGLHHFTKTGPQHYAGERLLGTPQKPGREARRAQPAVAHFAAKSSAELPLLVARKFALDIWGVPNNALFKKSGWL